MKTLAAIFLMYICNYVILRTGLVGDNTNKKGKKKGKKKDNNLKWKDLIFGVDIFFKNKIIYIFFHIINVLALILELIFSFMVEISDNPIWLFLQGRTFFISCCEFFAIIVVNFIDELIDKYL